LTFTRNLQKCNGDFMKKITRRCNVAASKR